MCLKIGFGNEYRRLNSDQTSAPFKSYLNDTLESYLDVVVRNWGTLELWFCFRHETSLGGFGPVSLWAKILWKL